MHLNELPKSMEGVVPLTDSRLRPDIRAMETGDIGTVCESPLLRTQHRSGVGAICWCHDVVIQASVMIHFADLASAEKKRLEEKQRAARKNRTKPTDEWKTR